jgi:hypothetical protein
MTLNNELGCTLTKLYNNTGIYSPDGKMVKHNLPEGTEPVVLSRAQAQLPFVASESN